jgi:hypothetical protein
MINTALNEVIGYLDTLESNLALTEVLCKLRIVQRDLAQLKLEAESAQAEKRQVSEAYDALAQRLNFIIRRNHRMTRLLRSAIPHERAIGCGLEGMVESILAIAASGERDVMGEERIMVENQNGKIVGSYHPNQWHFAESWWRDELNNMDYRMYRAVMVEIPNEKGDMNVE